MNKDLNKDWKIIDLSIESVQKAIGCSPAFFQKIMQDAEPTMTVAGIRIYATQLLPVTISDGSEVHAVIVAESPASINYPIWDEGNLVYPPLFSEWLTRLEKFT